MPPRELKIVPDGVGRLLPVVRESLAAVEGDSGLKPSVDKALRRLAETYAQAIDDASDLVAEALNVIDRAERDEIEVAKRTLNAIVKFSEGRITLSDLGPKLQSALESLGASPKARASMSGSGGGKPDDAGAGKPESSLERRRREADEREQRARADSSSSVDPSA